MKPISILLSLGVAGGVAAWLFLGGEGSLGTDAAAAGDPVVAEPADAAVEPDAPIRVATLLSQTQPLVETVRLRGVTEADRAVSVRAQVGGLVISEPLQAGTEVEAGQLLCRIEVGEREAALAEALAMLAQAETDAEASTTLAQRGFSADAEVARDAAALEAARAMVAQREIELARTEIVAPFAGRLETDAAEFGALLEPGAACAELVALDPILAVAYAAEDVVGDIEAGLTARVRLLDGREFDAVIAFVARSADGATRTFRVEARADNGDFSIRAGLTAELIVERPARPAHLLPASALVLDDEGRIGLRAVEDGRVVFHAVDLLREGRDGVWVAGPPDGVEVIVSGQAFVVEGALVEATQAPAPNR